MKRRDFITRSLASAAALAAAPLPALARQAATPFPVVKLGEVDRLRTENAVLRAILESVPQVKQLLSGIVGA